MSTHQLHPAFYASRRQLWATLTSGKTSRLWWFFRRTGIGSNCTSLSKVWYVIFILISGLWLIFNAICRYKDFKIQAYDPRFGNQWDESVLYLQLGAIILGVCLLPVLLYTSICRVGHSANDSVMLGRDTLHLQNLLLSLPTLHKNWKTSNMGSMGNMVNDTNPPGSMRCRNHQIQDDELDPFILKRRGEDILEQISHNFKPFSSIIYVLFTYTFLLPVCVMEAEQIKNEAIAPQHVFHTNMDRIFGRTPAAHYKVFFNQQNAKMDQSYPNDRPFPSHAYPLIPHELSTEYVFFLISLVIMTVQYGSPFYFTSRIFSLLFSVYTAFTSVFLLIDIDTISLVYKLSTAGVRDQGGLKTITLATNPSVFAPWYFLAFSAAGLPAILIGLTGIYAYGEIQFKHAVINYAQLLIAGELPSRNSPAKSKDLNNIDNPTCPDSIMTVEVAPGEHMGLDFGKQFAGLPLTLAVTTKMWRPPPTTANRRMTGNGVNKISGTPIPGSEMSGTLRRTRGMALAESTELTNSVHTLTETTDSTKTGNRKWSRVGLSVLAGISFVWFLMTRICLAGQILRCYWETKLEIALADLAMCVFYMIFWLILWFGLAVKTAWRFRLLHTVDCFYPTSNYNVIGQKFTFSNGFAPELVNSPGMRNLQMTMNGAYPNLWPYISYPSWISNGTGMMAGLPIGDTVDIDQLNTVPNPHGNDPTGESVRDSLYGCFTDVPPHSQTPAAEVIDRYQTRSLGMPLRAGPPTLSDESDTTGNNPEMTNKYFRPVPTPSINGSTYMNTDAHQTSNFNYSANANSPFPLNYNETPHETSPFDAYEDYILQNGSRNKGSKVAAVQALLQKQNMGSKVPDPTYATLANLTRPANGPNQRSASTTPVVTDLRDQATPPHLTRNTSYRRNCSRVTFKDNEMAGVGYRAVNNDGATGSSDSGVYTNGHGSGLNQTVPYVERQNMKSRNKPDKRYPMGSYKSNDLNNSTSPSVVETGFHPNRLNGIRDNDDIEMSTDLTSLGIRDNSKIADRIAYFDHSSPGLAEDPDDRLCSQV